MTPNDAIILLKKVKESGDWPMAPFVLRDFLESLGYTHVVDAYDQAMTKEERKSKKNGD
jgi:hypothetical protein